MNNKILQTQKKKNKMKYWIKMKIPFKILLMMMIKKTNYLNKIRKRRKAKKWNEANLKQQQLQIFMI